ncbi:MAG: DUF86 domain-containing protein [Ruminiclostridium sp.]|nr:DUF86 domain-containing protein [Ruminiclostridium sp.]
MPGIEVILEKLLKIKEYIEQLKKIKPESYKKYVGDMTSKYAVERIIQLIVDQALDINNILLSYMKKPPATDYFNSFIDLGECGVFDQTFALGIAPSAGLRNRLVHEYESVNDEIVYKSIDKVANMYTKYLIIVNGFINSK